MHERNHEVPLPGGGAITLDLSPGRLITIVGPNGAGKSAMSAALGGALMDKGIVNRIFAHRRLWLSSSATGMAPRERALYEQNSAMWDTKVEARWNDRSDSYRGPAILSDLVDRQNRQNALLADYVRRREATDGVATDGPIQILNSLLESAALEVRIGLSLKSELVATNRQGQTYPAAEMSDGEKASMLLVADVLAADPGSIHLIDEPERHLHRSISAPLIASLIQIRPTDTFVIFTHDLDLAQELGVTGDTYVVSRCVWDGKQPRAWDLERAPSTGSVSESLRHAVLGGRKKIVFHEGTESSIDQVLYRALLVGCHLAPVGNCAAVIRAVAGLRDSDELHWIEARGIVDRDFRREAAPSGVMRLMVHEAENAFYLPSVVRYMSGQQAGLLGLDAHKLEASAEEAMKSALRRDDVKANILNQTRLQQVRDDLMEQVQSLTALQGLDPVTFSATPSGGDLESEYDRLLEEGLRTFLTRFPIRESAARKQVALALKYQNAEMYERAVIQRIRTDSDFRETTARELGLDGI